VEQRFSAALLDHKHDLSSRAKSRDLASGFFSRVPVWESVQDFVLNVTL